MHRLTISIVIYNNPLRMLEKAIKSALNTSLDVALYLIDNSPTDKLKILASMDKRIEYIHNPSNPGYGTAHNIAIKQSIADGVKYHLVLNPDVYFDHGVLETIVEYMDVNSDIGLLMPKVLYPNGEFQNLCKMLPTPFNWISRFLSNYLKWNYFIFQNKLFEMKFSNFDAIFEVPYLSGCFMFIRTDILLYSGLFDENIFLHTEDLDLSRRIYKISKNIYYPYATIYHEHNKEAYRNLKIMLFQIKSGIYYFNKWGWFFDKQRKMINTKIIRAHTKEIQNMLKDDSK